jgi:hypothetical protein
MVVRVCRPPSRRTYVVSVTVTFPIIKLTQPTQYLMSQTSPGEILEGCPDATDHCQGLLSAVAISASSTYKQFDLNSKVLNGCSLLDRVRRSLSPSRVEGTTPAQCLQFLDRIPMTWGIMSLQSTNIFPKTPSFASPSTTASRLSLARLTLSVVLLLLSAKSVPPQVLTRAGSPSPSTIPSSIFGSSS